MSDLLKRFRCLGLMDPADQEVRPQRRLAPRLTEGRGTVGGFLDNRKHNASVLLDHLVMRLSCTYGMAVAMIMWTMRVRWPHIGGLSLPDRRKNISNC
jgi:hypothetical protein